MKHALHNPSSSNHWMNCGIWVHLKLQAIDAGIVEEEPGPAAIRGHKLHSLAEYAMGYLLWEDLDLTHSIDKAQKRFRKENKGSKKISEEDDADLRLALEAAWGLISGSDYDVMLELEVPLSHEPGSHGYVDLAAYSKEEDLLLILDYKFGQMAVSPNASQLRIYAANTLALIRDGGADITGDTRVKLAVVQPALHAEATVREYRAVNLLKYQAHVEAVVTAQMAKADTRGADNLSVCDWCDFKDQCDHRVRLLGELVSDLETPGEMPKHLIEKIVRSKKVFEGIIKECSAQIAKDEEGFPNFKRSVVANPRKWDTVIDSEEIASQLIDAGLKHPYALMSPAQAKSAYPKASALVMKLSSDQGSHVRLSYVEPGEDRGGDKEPEKRAKAPVRTVRPKAKTKKKAAKRAAKKVKK